MEIFYWICSFINFYWSYLNQLKPNLEVIWWTWFVVWAKSIIISISLHDLNWKRIHFTNNESYLVSHHDPKNIVLTCCSTCASIYGVYNANQSQILMASKSNNINYCIWDLQKIVLLILLSQLNPTNCLFVQSNRNILISINYVAFMMFLPFRN